MTKYKYFVREHSVYLRKVIYRVKGNNPQQFNGGENNLRWRHGFFPHEVGCVPISRDGARKLFPAAFRKN
jgi:hypothetical protein